MDTSSFIPDIALPRGNETPTITPLPSTGQSKTSESGATPSFKDQVTGLLQDVNAKLVGSSQNVRDLAMGKTNDIDRVVTSVEEANLALQYTIAIRGKLLDAYNEIARITV
jgi:flagellar hook-basal body complex protein FliE